MGTILTPDDLSTWQRDVERRLHGLETPRRAVDRVEQLNTTVAAAVAAAVPLAVAAAIDPAVAAAVPAAVTAALALLMSRTQTSEVAGPDTGPLLPVDGTWGDLSSAGPHVTSATGTTALVIGSAIISLGPPATYRNSTAAISYAVSGATTINPGTLSTQGELSNSAAAYLISTVTFIDVVTLTPGSNTFTMKFNYSGPTGVGTSSTSFRNMVIVVIPLDQ